MLGTGSLTAEKAVKGEGLAAAASCVGPACQAPTSSLPTSEESAPWPSIFVREHFERIPNSELGVLLTPSLDAVYATLPPPQVSRALMAQYEREVYFRALGVHLPTFLHECEQLYACVNDQQRNHIDPAWFALYFSIIAVTAQSITEDDKDFLEYAACPAIPQQRASALWFDASRICLQNSDAIHRPQLRGIQTMIYYDSLLSVGSSFYLPPSMWSCACKV